VANVLTNAITYPAGRRGRRPFRCGLFDRDAAMATPVSAPVYPFKMRGSVDSGGNVLMAPGEGHVSSTTNYLRHPNPRSNQCALRTILVRSDASATNILVKMDGGLDLNSQMGLAPTTGFDRRDNKPGYVSDVWLG